jgi:hypothetical protein
LEPAPVRITAAKQKLYDDALVQMVLQDLLPFSTVEKEGFRNFVAVLRPGYDPPGRTKLTAMIKQLYVDQRKLLIQFIKSQGKYLTYTTDLWKSAAKEYYVSVALHFIDESWTLHSPVVATQHIKGMSTNYCLSNFYLLILI